MTNYAISGQANISPQLVSSGTYYKQKLNPADARLYWMASLLTSHISYWEVTVGFALAKVKSTYLWENWERLLYKQSIQA